MEEWQVNQYVPFVEGILACIGRDLTKEELNTVAWLAGSEVYFSMIYMYLLLRSIPSFFKTLGFVELPADIEVMKARYKTLVKQYHPDAGGDEATFKAIVTAAEEGIKWFDNQNRRM
jgi:DnaJ-class molecular chaperone with C-terminal Zn finger domain